MSTPRQPPTDGSEERPAPTAWMPPNASTTPNAERYLLEADALRRRQLRSALLHGSSRTWREHRRIWPGIVAGLVVVAVILAAFKVVEAVKTAEEQQRQEQRQSVQFSPSQLARAAMIQHRRHDGGSPAAR